MNNIILVPLHKSDLNEVVAAFDKIGWNKPIATYEKYLEEQTMGERSIFIAKCHDKFCGYITLKWQSEYLPFKDKDIPEISDLNVLPEYRKHGIGTQLIQACERLGKQKGKIVIGIGVGLTEDYGSAQRLYFKLGYMPNGKGLHYQNNPVPHGTSVTADDDLTIFLIKELCSDEKRTFI